MEPLEAAQILCECLREAGADVEAGFAAAEYILSGATYTDIALANHPFVESQHPRGQPENVGEFVEKGRGSRASDLSDVISGKRRATENEHNELMDQGYLNTGKGYAKPQPRPEPRITTTQNKSKVTGRKAATLKSKAFKTWFGDWENDPAGASKVVNGGGDPQETHGTVKKVYHGSGSRFDTFDKNRIRMINLGQGFYFAESRDVAGMYSETEDDSEDDSSTGEPILYEAYLNIRNPLNIDTPEGYKLWNDTRESLARPDELEHLRGKKSVNAAIQKMGYDGIVHTSDDFGGMGSSGHGRHGRVWIAFEPNQIKSTSNRGTFASDNPNINLSDDPASTAPVTLYGASELLWGQPLSPGPAGGRATVLEEDYPRNRSNQFVNKHLVAEAARDPECCAALRESLPEGQRWKLDRAVAMLQAGGAVHHPREAPGLAIDISGAVTDPAWVKYDEACCAHEAWQERDAERADRRKLTEAFTKSLHDSKAAPRTRRAFTSAASGSEVATIKETRDTLEAATNEYSVALDALDAALASSGATASEIRSLARLRRRTDVRVARRVDLFLKGTRGAKNEERAAELLEELDSEFQAAHEEVEDLYEDVVEEIHKRLDEEAKSDPEPEEPEEPRATEPQRAAFAQSDKEKSKDDDKKDDPAVRATLIAEILVLLFGKDAEKVAKRLAEEQKDSTSSNGAAFANGHTPPQVRRRYGPRPGPGWRSAGISRNGQQIWLWGPAPGHGAAPTPAPQQPAPQQAPTPVHHAPAPAAPPQAAPAGPAPAPQPAGPPFVPIPVPPHTGGGGTLARANSVAAYNQIMAKLHAGQQLTWSDKNFISTKLTNMPTQLLRNLHNAVGGNAWVAGGRSVMVQNIKNILLGVSPAPANQPQAPTPQAPATPAYQAKTGFSGFDNTINNLLSGKSVLGVDIADAMDDAQYSISNKDMAEAVKALGGTVRNPNSSYDVLQDLRQILHHRNAVNKITAQQAAPAPQPQQAPQPPQASAPNLNANPNNLPVVPMTDEVNWETGQAKPGTLNGVDFAPAPPKFWEKVKDVDVAEPPPIKKVDRVGVMIQEPDGRIWICQPTNGFGNRKHTLPGGGVEKGLTDQQNALKEVWEETGIQCEITGHLGDFEDSNNGNNGRLYIGKRVGGAPWDAKIEPHITDNRTGKPAAESSAVTLVTPEKAAQLLHRTDDLAQLMTVHPPALNTPLKGNGSGPIKKFIAAMKPKIDAHMAKAKKANAKAGNPYLSAVQDIRGFNAKPKVVSKSDFDSLIKQGGHIEMLRGLKDHGYGTSMVTGAKMAEQFRSGDNFPGHGVFGSGTYTDSSKGLNNASKQYRGYGGGAMIRMALPKTAKIIKIGDLEKKVKDHPAVFQGFANGNGSSLECWMGTQAALAGYDAIHVDGSQTLRHSGYGIGFYIVLNRGVLVVQKEDASNHVIR